jgi:hypothetical protein
MSGGGTSAIGEAEGFKAALREEGYIGLVVTEGGAFRGLTQITLERAAWKSIRTLL